MTDLGVRAAAVPLARKLEALGIAYYVGGSVASSVHGLPRSTVDVDMVADIKRQHVQVLVEQLAAAYFVDDEMIEEAVAHRRSFNIIHIETGMKVDVFVLGVNEWDRTAMERATMAALGKDEGALSVRMATPEDTILHKLVWFKKGNETSERQWKDCQGILAMQGPALDREYLRTWAARIGVSELLERALAEAAKAP